MGKIAWENADVILVTSDNPRKEPPEEIISQILLGIDKESDENKSVLTEPDRRAAIEKALGMAKAGDAVLIAGKGHETGQYFSDRTIPFDDREVARNFFRATQDED
jgi:UDP-N-acetylmuramyl tripeptide synthase